MRVIEWAKKHQAMAIVAAIAGLWVIWRILQGKNILSAGHMSVQDAIDAGWEVYQAGPTGWLEVSPDQKQHIMHLEGWTEPFSG